MPRITPRSRKLRSKESEELVRLDRRAHFA